MGRIEKPASYGHPGKDTTTGHWELAGIILTKPFPTFPPEYPSFPDELTSAFTHRIGRGILGNYAASRTVITRIWVTSTWLPGSRSSIPRVTPSFRSPPTKRCYR